MVKKQLAEEDHKKAAAGESISTSTVSSMIIEGLEIEDMQRAIHSIAIQSKHTVYQETSIQQHQMNLLNQMQCFHKTQCLHIPQLAIYLPCLSSTQALSTPKKVTVVLPSTLDQQTHLKICSKEVVELEEHLRHVQAVESLARLQMHLHSRAITHKHVSNLAHSQTIQTQHKTLRDQLKLRIKTVKETYHGARAALLELRGLGEWTGVLQELKEEDICAIGESLLQNEKKEQYRKAQELTGVSEDAIQGYLGRTVNVATVPINPILACGESRSLQLSWIWYTTGEIASKASTKVKNQEEASIEEILVSFCEWKALWWREQIRKRVDVERSLAEGLCAYAMEHMSAETNQAAMWTDQWDPLQKWVEIILQCLDNPKVDLESVLKRMEMLEVEIDLRTEAQADEETHGEFEEHGMF
ncbi:hypothetical protein Moror_9208 [Moniliophthora roreri MCA 2997]|uniref:Uncharacterized protein n=1 Tax=Moniliophthora roreri (strain MCA 2997) TaxID=1381753 RepID=V2Y003_MONRO|nr:hypothetical protein Moror_9208 [Moniliophthora roreri MCA 2997]